MEQKKFGSYGYMGLLLILFAQLSLALKLRTITVWTTPVAWTGYILFVDALLFKFRGNSLIMTRTREFLAILPLSIGFWLIFEWYNLFIQNWHYINLPQKLWVRWIGYGWSFATIMPGIFETTEAVEGWDIFGRTRRRLRITRTLLYSFIIAGAACLMLPLVSPLKYARYMAALVWGGFIFLLEPVNYLLGADSILRDWQQGRFNKFFSLLLGGLICGLLWEYWNFWAYTKWIYTVPILGDIKIFEMPVVGYLGFPAFAVELYVMYSSAKLLKARVARSLFSD
ncbi:MAG: hypothetical protein DRQ02_04690 [Candidatus Latescibacterota bacterium]|nr:MAG: hypothetical protein DRQ02_04690 [Candidatus Latescibacterota bacterium]